MGSLSRHGYFEEVGGFGAQVYRNNDFSDVLKAEHPESLKDAVGFMWVLIMVEALPQVDEVLLDAMKV